MREWGCRLLPPAAARRAGEETAAGKTPQNPDGPRGAADVPLCSTPPPADPTLYSEPAFTTVMSLTTGPRTLALISTTSSGSTVRSSGALSELRRLARQVHRAAWENLPPAPTRVSRFVTDADLEEEEDEEAEEGGDAQLTERRTSRRVGPGLCESGSSRSGRSN
jgi:hypothetical protein